MARCWSRELSKDLLEEHAFGVKIAAPTTRSAENDDIPTMPPALTLTLLHISSRVLLPGTTNLLPWKFIVTTSDDLAGFWEAEGIAPSELTADITVELGRRLPTSPKAQIKVYPSLCQAVRRAPDRNRRGNATATLLLRKPNAGSFWATLSFIFCGSAASVRGPWQNTCAGVCRPLPGSPLWRRWARSCCAQRPRRGCVHGALLSRARRPTATRQWRRICAASSNICSRAGGRRRPILR